MTQLMAIATNTFRESVRDRVLYSIVFFAVLVLITSVMVKEITIGDQEKIVRSVALGAIRLASAVVSIFLGIGLVYKEIERKTIYTIASKPTPRWLFILGKYLGLMGVIVVQLLLMAALYVGLMTAEQGFPGASVFLSWGMLILEMALLTAWAILFSSYSSPVIATLFTVAVLVVGHLADDLKNYAAMADSELAKQVADALYWILPNFSIFNVHDLAVYHLPIPGQQLLGATIYGLSYTAVVLAAAMLVFQRRDFK
ncbi:MAG: ABC transporter permease [Alphaproteobacteria bacterium]|nr:ABC transporter permease [Alphaproteobacteria bacterium]